MDECKNCGADFDFEEDGGVKIIDKLQPGLWENSYYCCGCYEDGTVKVLVPVDESKDVDW